MKPRVPVRVLLIHGEAIYFGGAETLLTRLVTAGLGADVQLTVARVTGGPLARALPAHVATVNLPPNQPFSPGGFRRQLGALPLRECEVLHAWGTRSWELAALAGQLANRPVVGTLHDHPEADYLTPTRRRLMRWLARWGLQRVTTVSQTLRDACVAAGWPPEKLTVIRNGVTVPPAVPRVVGQPVRFGFLGSLTAAKGLPDLLGSAAALARRASSGWELHIAGTAQTPAEAAQLRTWQEAWHDNAWWAQVHWHGGVVAEEFLCRIDVLIVPSRAFETFSLALAEAALAGVPTIAANFGALPELVRDGRTGRLFAPGDAEACGTIMAELLVHPNSISLMGEAARTVVAQECSFEKMIAAYRTILSAEAQNGR